ncbi:carboxymuconolactone decarboxylase family protein [Loktanella sp. R86503]|uniref:carboxymuconolactone decarboxylase family protein n=1 Tax=Loktanella TaxID=245186 RepID=UPI0036DADA5E
MNWKDHLAGASANLSKFRKTSPETAKGFGALSQAALAPGHVDLRHKELMCIAIGIAKQCDDCIGFHVKAAIAAGVTREEIAETISVAMYMGGGPSFMYGARALEAFDQMSV